MLCMFDNFFAKTYYKYILLLQSYTTIEYQAVSFG